MKKVIRSITFDTDASELVGNYNYGQFGDPRGYSEKLYKTPDGLFFFHTQGGTQSVHTTEKLSPVSEENAAKWLQAHVQ